MNDFTLGTLIFVLAYAAIISERIHKTVVALAGASLVLLLGITTQHEAFHTEEFGIDYNVIFLLVGMMIIVNITKESGVFQWIAIKAAKLARGEPLRVMVLLSLVTAVLSALLDNVTTVLLIAPVTLLIADALEVDPVPILIAEVLASNIGGTATLIGDPPNIMIASKAQLTFMDFIIHLAPVVILIMIGYLAFLRFLFRKHLHVTEEQKARIMAMDESKAITDPVLMRKSLGVIAAVMVGFILHGWLHLMPATIALAGAAALFLVARSDPHHVLSEVEWPTIFFFIGLFIMVGGLVKVGAIKILSEQVLALTQGDFFATSMLIMWFSAIASGIVDNIPYVATMNPLVVDMARELWPELSGTDLLHHPDLMPVWWSLALGACLGGNATFIGASANVIVCGISEKAGHPIGFWRFARYGLPVTFLSVVISTLYVWVRYYLL